MTDTADPIARARQKRAYWAADRLGQVLASAGVALQ